jgi:glutamate synthase (NADPH/NADH) small chain
VAIKQVELAIAERAFDEGWARPRPPPTRTGCSVAVVGSGPAGLAAASRLNHRGHSVTVFETDEAPGGLLRFGIPDFKLDKRILDRRIHLLRGEGIAFRCGVEVGRDLPAEELEAEFNALVLAIGSRVPRELSLPGRELAGVHFAMEYLYGCNRALTNGGGQLKPKPVSARDRDVVVIGGGDTAMDCVGNAHREEARSVTLLDIYPAATASPSDDTPWPEAPRRLPMTYALEEGGQRLVGHGAQRLQGEDGTVVAVEGSLVGPPPEFVPVPQSAFKLPADLVLIAVGFLHADHGGLLGDLGLALDPAGNVARPPSSLARRRGSS